MPELNPIKFVNGFVDGADLVLLYRNASGEMLARRRKAEWSSFYRRADVTAEAMRSFRNSSFVLGVSEEGEWVRVRWQAPEWRSAVREGKRGDEEESWERRNGLTSFEADVTPEQRFLADTGAQVAKPRRVFLDIETDSRVQPVAARQGKARVLCWCLVDDDERIVAQGVLEREDDVDERRILEALWAALDPYDQVVAWFGDGFDFPVIRQRSVTVEARYKDPRRWLWMDFLPVYARMNANAAESGDEKESMKLNDVCMSRIGIGKHDFDASKTYEAWAAGGESRARLVEYCAQDTKLLPMLNKKTGFLDVNDAVCSLCKLFADTRSADPTQFVDGFLLQLAVERGTHFATRARYSKEDQERHEKFQGAVVTEPKVSGIEKHVHVADFSGMYPSIIQSFNMSPETKRPVNINGPIADGCCRAPVTRVGFANSPEGILPEAVRRMREKRASYQKHQASLVAGTSEWAEAGRLSAGYKVLVNSFYGVVGSPFSRYFDRQVAESISTTGVWLIHKTDAEAERRGMNVVYNDTDSAFVKNVSRQDFAEFVRWSNAELYPAALRECGCTSNFIEIAYEKEFERLVMVSKKRYVGTFAHYKWVAACACDDAKGRPGKIDVRRMTCDACGRQWDDLPPPRGKPEIRGLEYKRGDVIRSARGLQLEVIDLLMRELCEDPARFVPVIERVRKRVLEDSLAIEDIRKSAALRKPLHEYKPKAKADGSEGTEQAHVRVARVLKARGEQILVDTKIAYFVVDASVSPMVVAPASDYAGECDRYYLWEDLVYPPTQRLLAAAFPPVKGMTSGELVARDWDRFLRVRPKKPRARKGVPEALARAQPRNPGSAGPSRLANEAHGSLFDLPVMAVRPQGAV
jgi:DNA polymerase elongation subunit (family B)